MLPLLADRCCARFSYSALRNGGLLVYLLLLLIL